MDDTNRRVLANMTKKIVESLTNPVVMVGVSLVKYFTESDRQLVERENDRYGSARATQVLVQLLEKRGPNVFRAFVEALKTPHHKLCDLADEIEREEAKLRGHPIHPFMQRAARSTEEESDMHPTAVERSVSCPVQPSQIVARGPVAATSRHANNQSHESQQSPPNGGQGAGNSVKYAEEALGINMLLKNIPSNVHQNIVQHLNVEDPLRKDWRAIAGCMGLSAAETKILTPNKMDGLFEIMTHRNMRVQDLVRILADKEVDRRDLIDELKSAGLVNDSDLRSLTDEDHSDFNSTELSAFSTVLVAAVRSPSEDTELLSPQQAKNPKCAKDDSARHPVQQESPDKGAVPANVMSPGGNATSKPPGPTPLQETNRKRGDEASGRHPVQQESVDEDDESTSERWEDLKVSDDDDEDIHGGHISKVALVIGCLKYKNLDSLENFTKSIKNLDHTLDNGEWRVTRKMGGQECSSIALREEINNFVATSKKKICLVYLVGHTVQINGENYLLPTDIDTNTTKADLVLFSINVNQLIQSLNSSHLSLVFLDGAHHCTHAFQCSGLLKGLAPISTLDLPNIVVASACMPGTIRSAEEQLYFIKSLIEQLDTAEGLSVKDLFTNIRKKVPQLGASSSPVEYSLTRSVLPFCFNSAKEGSKGMLAPNGSTPRYAIIFTMSKNGQNPHTEHLMEALNKARWHKERHNDLTADDIMAVLRDKLTNLSDNEMKVVMVYFIGSAFQTESGENFLAGVNDTPGNQARFRHVPAQWIVDLMCELVIGPKLLVVDDVFQTSRERGLAPMIAPQECLLSLPCARDSDRPAEYTLRLSQLIGSNPERPMKKILARASGKEHLIYSNLFFA